MEQGCPFLAAAEHLGSEAFPVLVHLVDIPVLVHPEAALEAQFQVAQTWNRRATFLPNPVVSSIQARDRQAQDLSGRPAPVPAVPLESVNLPRQEWCCGTPPAFRGTCSWRLPPTSIPEQEDFSPLP